MAALRIGRLVADHPGVSEREAEVVARLQQRAGGRLPAAANERVAGSQAFGVMQTVAEAREADPCGGELACQLIANPAVDVVAHFAQSVIRLIGDEDQGKASALQALESGDHAVEKTKIGRMKRRFHAAGSRVQDGRIENAIAVEEDRRPYYFADSHFISFERSRG